MAKSLANFVVGIGMDAAGFKAGAKEVNSSMLGIRTGSLAAGAALATALTAVTGIAIGTAKSINELDLQMQYSDASIQYAYNFGNAVERLGGQASDAYGEIINMQKALNAFQREGASDKLEAVAILGIDPSGLFNLENDLITFQSRLADTLINATPKQKLGIQEIFGLSDATMRLLEQGSYQVNFEMGLSEQYTGNIENMTDASQELLSVWNRTKQEAEGFTNVIAEKSMPAMTKFIQYTREAFKSIVYAFPGNSPEREESPEEVEQREIESNNRLKQWHNMLDAPAIDERPKPTAAGALFPQILMQQDAPEVTHIQNNSVTTNNVAQQSIKQPIQIQNHITTSVELDKRKVGESVTQYQEEQYFIVEQGLVGTTVA